MTRRFARLLAVLFASHTLVTIAAAQHTPADPPALVLFITVDQLRGDMPMRYYPRLTGGLRTLLDHGAWFTDAHYHHGVTVTASGHATLFTGASPCDHGIVGNFWQDRASGKRQYCVEDAQFPVLGESASPKRVGLSPRSLLASTIGDELILASSGRSRVFAVGGKDRASILPGGQRGKAFWYSPRTGGFTTSSYYMTGLPAWLVKWNESKPFDKLREGKWELLNDRSTYLFGDRDDQPCEYGYGSLGRTFPHPIKADSDTDFYETLYYTPMFDEITVSLLDALIEGEKLGSGPTPDLLSISFCATDYIGHAWGPDSLEAEDNLLRLDQTIGKLLKAVDARVGLKRTLVVLSADHGVDSSPEYRHLLACPPDQAPPQARIERMPDGSVQFVAAAGGGALCNCNAGRQIPEQFIGAVNAALRKRFKAESDFVTRFWNPCLYLDESAIAKAGLAIADVERATAEEVLKLPGFTAAVARSDFLIGRVPLTRIGQMMLRSFHPNRSGHVMIVQSPFWYLYPDAKENAAMHGSPHNYDTHVPIVFMGAGIEPRRIARLVGPENIAATLAQILGVCQPSAAEREVLSEALPSATR